MIYLTELQRIANALKEIQTDLSSEMSRLPDGRFYSYDRNGTRYYYKRIPKTGNLKKERRQGIGKDPGTLNALVRKEYVTEALRRIAKDIDCLESVLDNYVPFDENSVMDEFTRKYPELSSGVYLGTHGLEEWADSYNHQSNYHKEHLTSTARDGSKRRSLGEILIGAKLDHYKIPYRYEAPAHPDLSYIPDFKIRRPRDGKIMFWEHIGMVTDEAYMARNRKKFDDYESVGIVPWDNLIISYNQIDGGINEKLIDALIQGWLL